MVQIITIRKGQPSDLLKLQELFIDTIFTICKADYTDEQLKVWASGVENVSRWQSRLAQQYVLVAEINNTIAGFCTLYKGTYLDFLYIHKDYQRQGIAYQLYNAIESEARQQNQTKLTSDVSKTARLFFESMGFIVLIEQTVIMHGVELNNYKMEKTLIY